MKGFKLKMGSNLEDTMLLAAIYITVIIILLIVLIIGVMVVVKRHFHKRGEKAKVVVNVEKNEVLRRQGLTRQERPRTLPPHITLNSESNLHTVKVKTLAVTVTNKLDEEGTEV